MIGLFYPGVSSSELNVVTTDQTTTSSLIVSEYGDLLSVSTLILASGDGTVTASPIIPCKDFCYTSPVPLAGNITVYSGATTSYVSLSC